MLAELVSFKSIVQYIMVAYYRNKRMVPTKRSENIQNTKTTNPKILILWALWGFILIELNIPNR